LNRKDLLAFIKGVPRILGFTYTEKIAEIKMEFCGISIGQFMKLDKYQGMSETHRTMVMFDMIK
jgi:hypothetical protein